jgi:hypothetical protein
VNTPPALEIDTTIDQMVKPRLVKDILELIDFEKYEDYQK